MGKSKSRRYNGRKISLKKREKGSMPVLVLWKRTSGDPTGSVAYYFRIQKVSVAYKQTKTRSDTLRMKGKDDATINKAR